MKPKYIIIHHSLTKDSGTVSWGAIRKHHTEELGWRDIGYHYGIELVGDKYEILVGRMQNDQGAHTVGVNFNSLGIMLCGNFDISIPSKDQWDLAVKLVSSLADVFGILVENVKGHHDYAGYKTCPGKNFDMDKFREAIK